MLDYDSDSDNDIDYANKGDGGYDVVPTEDEVDWDEGADADTAPSSFVDGIKKLYDSVFFYGLNTPKVRRRSIIGVNISRDGFKRWKKRAKKAMANNPFLTESERLGLYMITSNDVDPTISRDDVVEEEGEDSEEEEEEVDDGCDAYEYEYLDDSDNVNRIPSKDTYRSWSVESSADGNISEEPRSSDLPYDPRDYASLTEFGRRLERYVARAERRLALMQVSLAAATEAETAPFRQGNLYEGISPQQQPQQQQMEELRHLQRDYEELKAKLQLAKVELVTATALAEELFSEQSQ